MQHAEGARQRNTISGFQRCLIPFGKVQEELGVLVKREVCNGAVRIV